MKTFRIISVDPKDKTSNIIKFYDHRYHLLFTSYNFEPVVVLVPDKTICMYNTVPQTTCIYEYQDNYEQKYRNPERYDFAYNGMLMSERMHFSLRYLYGLSELIGFDGNNKEIRRYIDFNGMLRSDLSFYEMSDKQWQDIINEMLERKLQSCMGKIVYRRFYEGMKGEVEIKSIEDLDGTIVHNIDMQLKRMPIIQIKRMNYETLYAMKIIRKSGKTKKELDIALTLYKRKIKQNYATIKQ